MSTFPALIPSTRSYSPGEFPHTAHPLLSGSEIRVRHSNTVLGVRLRLTFTAITSADLLAVRNHYRDRQGGFLPFAIPAELLSGVTTPADFTPTGHQWRYAARPSVTDVPIPGATPTNRHDLVLELESVPPENTIVSGARITVRATVRGGSAQLGAYIESFASVAGGAAVAEASTSALGAAITASASVAGGTASGNPLADPLTAEASVVGGAASAGTTDLDFASVSLLLHMDGSNGSTTFTDSSTNAVTVTANGNAQIGTAQSKFGGASALFDGSGDYLSVSSNAVFNVSGAAFTAECWVRAANVSQNGGAFFSSRIDVIYAPFEVRIDGSGVSWLIANDAVNNWVSLSSKASVISASTWHHVALVGTGSTLTFYVDGVSALTTSQPTWTSANRPLYIGAGGDAAFNGHIDEFRFTKGVARYTSNFTPPTEPFPDS